MMKKRMRRLMFELIKNSKRSDREIAKILGVSQPTITRLRQKLEKKGITEYTVIPNWLELGFELIAFTFIRLSRQRKLEEKTSKWAEWNPNVVFAGWGEGMGMDGAIISLHPNYTDFSSFIAKLKIDLSDGIQDIQSFLMTTSGEMEIKPFSFKYLETVQKSEL